MPSLLCLGGTCLYHRDRVSHILKKERNSIIGRYWPQPERLLWILSRSRAVITGEAALAFIMRDRSLLTKELEVCVSRLYAEDLLQELDASDYVKHTPSDQPRSTLHHDQPTTFEYKSKYDDVVRVICSHTDSVFTPFAMYPTTALFNYMDEFSFGCTYHNLTLNRWGVAPNIHPVEEEQATRAHVN